MTVIQSGVDTTLAEVDDTHKALHVIHKSNNTLKFDKSKYITDSFNRLRVSSPYVVFDHTFGSSTPATTLNIFEGGQYGAGPVPTLTTNLYGTDLLTTTANFSGNWIQSYANTIISQGISTILKVGFCFNGGFNNVVQRVGLYGDSGTSPLVREGDGVYLELNGKFMYFVHRYRTEGMTGHDDMYAQYDWNLDKMDGTGASGITLDISKAQHLVIEYQLLVIKLGFETTQGIVWAHQINAVNNTSTLFSATPALPFSAEIFTTNSATQPGKLTLISCAIIQEGIVVNRPYRYFGATSGATAKVGGTSAGLFPLLSLRAASTNDLVKRVLILPTSLDINVVVVGTGTTSLRVALLINPTPLTGASYGVSIPGSVTNVDIAATATTAVTGIAIWSAVIPNVVGKYSFDLSNMALENINRISYRANYSVATTGMSILTLACGTLTGTTTTAATIVASINWKEIL